MRILLANNVDLASWNKHDLSQSNKNIHSQHNTNGKIGNKTSTSGDKNDNQKQLQTPTCLNDSSIDSINSKLNNNIAPANISTKIGNLRTVHIHIQIIQI